MAVLPSGTHKFYAGIDPGFTGAIGLINASGSTVQVWDMPITPGDSDRRREIDLAGLEEVFKQLCRRPDVVVGIEWPTTRPKEGAERSERFGRGKGILHAYAFLKRLDFYLISPNLWKGRLNVPGKTDPDADRIAAQLFDTYYPDYSALIRGPRGGIKNGRCDALLIAHFLRTQTVAGIRSVVKRFGAGSTEAMALALGGRRRRRKIVR